MSTLVRKPADPFRADILRKERSPLEGEIVTPKCVACGNAGYVVYQDEWHRCRSCERAEVGE